MHRSQFATAVAIGLLFVCNSGWAADRPASRSQRYTIHVPKEVKFGLATPAVAAELAERTAKKDTKSLVFLAETTSGMTIQFETQSEPARKPALKLTVGGSQQGNWWANKMNDASESTHESVAEGTSVEASTRGAGWTTLTIDTISPDATSPNATSAETVTTIVVTIVAH